MMDVLTVTIKPATLANVPALRQFSIDTFTDTYAKYNTPENMRLYIETYFNLPLLTGEIGGGEAQYYLAYCGDVLAGYVKMRTTEQPAELAGFKHIEIERIYVAPAFKGQKIGKQLIEHCLTVAGQQGFEILWLGVWEENKNAMAFYTKQGFAIFGDHVFMLGDDKQRDWLMKIAVPTPAQA